QEYRDSSKQQEIEQRRQAESMSPGEVRRSGSDSSAVSPPSLQLQLRNTTHSLSLWQNLEVVQNSGLLHKLPQKEIIMQEAMFELVSSEASYYKSLEILETHFLRNPVLINTLSQSDMHFLFSNIEGVMKASEHFLMDLEHRIEESILISDVCDIVYTHAEEHFNVFITYVINQNYQEKNYRRILEGNQAFRDVMETLEKHPRVRGLSFPSFLILPFQRITRLKLLVQNILKKAEEGSEREANAIKAHQRLEQIVKECNEGVRKMSRTEELISIEKTLEFKSKSIPIISHSRWLLKKGEVQLMSGPKSTRTTKGKKLYQPVYLFLFNNLLLITKRNSSPFFTTMDRYSDRITADAAPIRQSISRRDSPPTRRGQTTFFRSTTMALDLEELILIPAASHSAANHPSACCRSWLKEAIRTTSSANSRDEILWFPNQTPSSPWLRLEILFINIMNRTGDKGQPWRSPTCTGNRSDLLPAMRTQLLLRSYRDQTALSKEPRTPYSQSSPQKTPRGTRSNAFSRSTKHMWTGWAYSHEPSRTRWRV
uniref:DH domain-containing protein n=1 Tax=Periophthalmus magnuspinnatus TaxID=409849 RepID=A0A3B4ACZ8_9GOBI